MSADFAPWLARCYAQAMAALDGGRLPHALLLGGPAGLGKRRLAQRLARRIMCSAPVANDACGHCRNCILLATGTHPDLYEVGFLLNDKGEPRKEIVISQIRALSEKLQKTPQIAMGQVAIIHPAEAMNRSAFNALLKTLEEPPAGRHLILVSDQPQRLPATIRSRCQWLRVSLPPRNEALQFLEAQGVKPANAEEALDAAQGNPGLAADYLENDGTGLRRAVAKDLAALASGRGSVAEIAVQWADEQAAQRLRFVGTLVRDHLASRAGAAHPDLLASAGMSSRADPLALADWFNDAARVLNNLDAPLRADLQIAELLTNWQRVVAAA